MKQSRAWLIWSVGLFAYGVAVFHRTSLAVSGVDAAHRFGVGASLLATLSVAQLGVYALMQVPVGVLLDRFGSRRLLLVGACLMGLGQFAFAFVSDIRLAIAARVLVGVGDAMTFISVLRVLSLWFPARRNPLMVQLTAMLGQLGALVSAAPLLVLLHNGGWTVTFVTAAGFGALSTALIAAVMRDSPSGSREGPAGLPAGPGDDGPGHDGPGNRGPGDRGRPRGALSFAAVRRDLSASWSEPGTRLGLWTHFVTPFSGLAFAVMWGYPFLVQGEGLAPGSAALLLSGLTVAGIVCGPLIGQFCGRRPYHRSSVVLAIVGTTALAWGVVLLWPGRAPLWMLVLLVLVLAINGPGSMIGLDYARTFNPSTRLGSATGIVNVGGFFASILLITGIGLVLDRLSPTGGSHYSLDAFRWAFALQYVLWGLGAVQVVRYRNAARRRLAESDPEAFALMRRQPALAVAD
jgi:sugar phosphate permease